MRQLKVHIGHKLAEKPLCVFQVIPRDDQAIGLAEAIKFSQMTNPSAAIVCRDCSILAVMKEILSYAGHSACNAASHLLKAVSWISPMI